MDEKKCMFRACHEQAFTLTDCENWVNSSPALDPPCVLLSARQETDVDAGVLVIYDATIMSHCRHESSQRLISVGKNSSKRKQKADFFIILCMSDEMTMIYDRHDSFSSAIDYQHASLSSNDELSDLHRRSRSVLLINRRSVSIGTLAVHCIHKNVA